MQMEKTEGKPPSGGEHEGVMKVLARDMKSRMVTRSLHGQRASITG